MTSPYPADARWATARSLGDCRCIVHGVGHALAATLAGMDLTVLGWSPVPMCLQCAVGGCRGAKTPATTPTEGTQDSPMPANARYIVTEYAIPGPLITREVVAACIAPGDSLGLPGCIVFKDDGGRMVYVVRSKVVRSLERLPAQDDNTGRPAAPLTVRQFRIHRATPDGWAGKVFVEFTDGTVHEHQATSSAWHPPDFRSGAVEDLHLSADPAILAEPITR